MEAQIRNDANVQWEGQVQVQIKILNDVAVGRAVGSADQ